MSRESASTSSGVKIQYRLVPVQPLLNVCARGSGTSRTIDSDSISSRDSSAQRNAARTIGCVVLDPLGRHLLDGGLPRPLVCGCFTSPHNVSQASPAQVCHRITHSDPKDQVGCVGRLFPSSRAALISTDTGAPAHGWRACPDPSGRSTSSSRDTVSGPAQSRSQGARLGWSVRLAVSAFASPELWACGESSCCSHRVLHPSTRE